MLSRHHRTGEHRRTDGICGGSVAMSTTVTKTLQATFAPPTAHKQSKLKHLLETYRDGLQEAFDAGASTMSAVSEIVTPY
ncbi:MAG: hypothetical protein J07HQX50_01999, partial [Haloquadratum sp. J07HQX50]